MENINIPKRFPFIFTQNTQELFSNGISAKTRWGNIRDNFRKSVKKNKTVSEQKAKKIKQYKYAQQLSFIMKFIDERDTMSNIDDKVANENINKTKYAPPSKTDASTVMDVDAFLSGIAPILKKLTPRNWHYAKADIFDAVQNYELKMIMDQKQYAQPYPISTYSTS
ncbi:hypothetical protein QTP88_010682 [Uroleucon formosanum]